MGGSHIGQLHRWAEVDIADPLEEASEGEELVEEAA